jgi:putative (di)nucleoside polyphosphate hydrolase
MGAAKPKTKPYRQCVVGVFRNRKGQILLLERSDTAGAWQLPQGGVEAGETLDDALRREMLEEVGTDGFEVIVRGSETVRYEWPENARGKYKNKYCGQEQHWYLLHFGRDPGPNLMEATETEFSDYKWATVAEAIEGIIEWKREAYVKGFLSIGLKA